MKQINKRKFIGAKAFLVAGALSQAIAGCANMPYPLSAVPPKPPSLTLIPVASTELPETSALCSLESPRCAEFELVIVEIAKFRDEYWAGFAQAGNSSYWFDVPLIGLALGTVGAATYGAHTDLIAGLGLGAAAVGGARSYVNPNEVASALRSGARSATCVLTSSRTLRDLVPPSEAFSPYEALSRRLSDLRSNTAKFRGMVRAAEREVKGDQALELAVRAMNEAIRTAESAVATAEVERRAFATRFEVVIDAIWAISDRTANRLAGTRQIDYATSIAYARSAINQAATKEQIISESETAPTSTTEAPPERTPTTEELLTAGAADLLRETSRMLDGMPNYSGAIANIAQCTQG